MCGKKKENKFEITMTVYNDDTQYGAIKSSHGSFYWIVY